MTIPCSLSFLICPQSSGVSGRKYWDDATRCASSSFEKTLVEPNSTSFEDGTERSSSTPTTVSVATTGARTITVPPTAIPSRRSAEAETITSSIDCGARPEAISNRPASDEFHAVPSIVLMLATPVAVATVAVAEKIGRIRVPVGRTSTGLVRGFVGHS